MPPLTPLLRPGRYFAEREVSFLRVMVVVGLVVAAGPAVVYGVGWVLAAHLDGTVMVDNPDRPPDWVCEDRQDDTVFDTEDCDAPREVERDVDTVLWDAIDGFVGPAIVAVPLVLGVVTLLLHGGAWLAGAERGLSRTFAVAAWGVVPSLVAIPVLLVVLALTLDPVTVTPGDDPATAIDPLLTQIRALEPYSDVGSVLTALWGGVVWRSGLVHEQGLDAGEATLVAGLVAAGVALFALA